jgi:c-di-GMP-binding flagellar brake protein YcgR
MPDAFGPRPPADSVLYRSRIEIARILEGLAQEGTAIFAYLVDKDDEQLFVSNVHSVHAESDYFGLSYGFHKSTNGAIFRQAALRFKAHYRGGRISFVAQRPLDATIGGQPVVKFAFPKALLHYYREYARTAVPDQLPLKCVVPLPGEPALDMQVTDISLDGMGCILHKRPKGIAQGTVLKDCRIPLPGGQVVSADLIVRHSTLVTLRDGTHAYRTGVRFVQTPDEIRPLIDQFVHILDLQ